MLEILTRHAGASEEYLAQQIASRAQELSLDSSVDSPFALLAKDNDIMWGGGRPDDITVIVSTVVDTSSSEPPPKFDAFAGPGPAPEIVIKPPAAPEGEENIHSGNWD